MIIGTTSTRSDSFCENSYRLAALRQDASAKTWAALFADNLIVSQNIVTPNIPVKQVVLNTEMIVREST